MRGPGPPHFAPMNAWYAQNVTSYAAPCLTGIWSKPLLATPTPSPAVRTLSIR